MVFTEVDKFLTLKNDFADTCQEPVSYLSVSFIWNKNYDATPAFHLLRFKWVNSDIKLSLALSFPALLHQVSKSLFRSSQRVWRQARPRNPVCPLPNHPRQRGGTRLSSSRRRQQRRLKGGSDSQLTRWPGSRSSLTRYWCTATAAVRAGTSSECNHNSTSRRFSSVCSVSVFDRRPHVQQTVSWQLIVQHGQCSQLLSKGRFQSPQRQTLEVGPTNHLSLRPPTGLLCTHKNRLTSDTGDAFTRASVSLALDHY